jgi:hypothetical protein
MMIALCKDTSPDRASRPRQHDARERRFLSRRREDLAAERVLTPAAVNATEELQDE